VEQYQNMLNCLQPTPWGDYNAQVHLQIAVIGQSTGGSKIILRGSNSGFGPLMTRYIKKQLEKMMNEIRRASELIPPSSYAEYQPTTFTTASRVVSSPSDQCSCLQTRAQHDAMGRCLAPPIGGIPTFTGLCLCNRFTLAQ
jgi:hypothetical protein